MRHRSLPRCVGVGLVSHSHTFHSHTFHSVPHTCAPPLFAQVRKQLHEEGLFAAAAPELFFCLFILFFICVSILFPSHLH